MNAVRLAVGTLLAAVLLTGCGVGSPTDRYRGHAEQAAGQAGSAAQTAMLATDTWTRGNLPRAAFEQLLSQSEADLDAASASFQAHQPPATAAADRLHANVGDLIDSADATVRTMRIAAHRHDAAGLAKARADLTEPATGLVSAADELAAP